MTGRGQAVAPVTFVPLQQGNVRMTHPLSPASADDSGSTVAAPVLRSGANARFVSLERSLRKSGPEGALGGAGTVTRQQHRSVPGTGTVRCRRWTR
jgi:hypothetical protein